MPFVFLLGAGFFGRVVGLDVGRDVGLEAGREEGLDVGLVVDRVVGLAGREEVVGLVVEAGAVVEGAAAKASTARARVSDDGQRDGPGGPRSAGRPLLW